MVEFGLDTFGDVTAQADGTATPCAQVIRDVVAEAVQAEAAGIDVFSVGEHHRDDFAVSAPEIVLAAAAGATRRIRLGTAVTVLSSDEPVRLFQRMSTLHAVSGGRAEVIVGRGSFTESFPLFGFDMREYEVLFEEKLDLFAALLRGGKVTWSGSVRPPLVDQPVFPLAEPGLRAWVGVGGSPESVVRAARHGLPLMLAIIGGDPARFTPFVELYERALKQLGQVRQPVGVHSPGHVADTDEQAREEFWPAYRVMHARIGKERGWPPMRREQFDAEVENGSLYVGGPDTVARKIARTVRVLRASRFQLKYSAGPLAHASMMRCIELYGTRVVPTVRAMLAETAAQAAE